MRKKKNGDKESSKRQKEKSEHSLCGFWLWFLCLLFIFVLFGFLYFTRYNVVKRRMQHLKKTKCIDVSIYIVNTKYLKVAQASEKKKKNKKIPQQFLSCGGSEVFRHRHIQLLLIWAYYKQCLLWPALGIVKKKDLGPFMYEAFHTVRRLTRQRKYLDKSLQFFRFTLPNMVCLLLSSSARPKVKKNWLPLSCGPAFAMATKPLRLKRNLEWNSSYK